MSGNNEDKSIIQYSPAYGCFNEGYKYWDDLEDLGEKQLLNLKITKIRIYSGKFNGKDVILGVGFTYKDINTGEEKVIEHKGSDDFIDVKEFEINQDEYLTDFHIRFTNDAEYITQLGYSTNKQNSILVGTEEGDDKYIDSNGGKYIIVGSIGCVKKKLDATGILFIDKEKYFQLQKIIKI